MNNNNFNEKNIYAPNVLFSFVPHPLYLHNKSKNLDGKTITWSTHSRALIGKQRGGGGGPGGPGGNGQVQAGTQIWLTLSSVSADRYLFEQSYSIYQNAQNNPFAEPVILHNNIKNGFGIFTTAAETTYTFKLK